jgi:hypothetical protein
MLEEFNHPVITQEGTLEQVFTNVTTNIIEGWKRLISSEGRAQNGQEVINLSGNEQRIMEELNNPEEFYGDRVNPKRSYVRDPNSQTRPPIVSPTQTDFSGRQRGSSGNSQGSSLSSGGVQIGGVELNFGGEGAEENKEEEDVQISSEVIAEELKSRYEFYKDSKDKEFLYSALRKDMLVIAESCKTKQEELAPSIPLSQENGHNQGGR